MAIDQRSRFLWSARVPTCLLGVAFVLQLAGCFARAAECTSFPSDGSKREFAIADRVGRAIEFPTDRVSGVHHSVQCIGKEFDVEPGHFPDSAESLSIGLLSIMTIDPKRFVEALSQVPDRAIRNWLGPGLQMAEIEHIGACVAPDRFEQGRKALVGFRPPENRQLKLTELILKALEKRKCRIP